jgi:hypothetical protein
VHVVREVPRVHGTDHRQTPLHRAPDDPEAQGLPDEFRKQRHDLEVQGQA